MTRSRPRTTRSKARPRTRSDAPPARWRVARRSQSSPTGCTRLQAETAEAAREVRVAAEGVVDDPERLAEVAIAPAPASTS